MAELSVRIGRTGDKGKTDESRIAKGRKPYIAEVEGQMWHDKLFVCPTCWSLNDVTINPQMFMTYFCWNCGAILEV